MPPRHGKSELDSKYFPAWYLGTFPDRRVILASYEASFAASWGRKARDVLEEHGAALFGGLRVRQDSRASDWWEIDGRDGGMVTAGAGGAITGKGAHLLLIDDPIKNAEEAQSKARRDSIWEWFQSTAYTRLEPEGAIVLTMTQWHEDDLGGRLLRQMAEGGERWEVLRFPALAEGPGAMGAGEADELGRAEGEALWPERYDLEAFARIRRTVGPHVWSALYQQRPLPIGGGLFRREWFRHYERLDERLDGAGATGSLIRIGDRVVSIASLRRFATVDLAASTKTTADYTVISSWGVEPGPAGVLVLLDVDRARREGPDIVPALRRARERWDLSAIWVERVGFQLALVQEARRAGLPIRELEADKDKVARALPATAEYEGGRVWHPRSASWLDDCEAELLSMPGGAHDDFADTVGYAVRVARAYGPIVAGEIEPARAMPRAQAWDERRARLLDEARREASGHGEHGGHGGHTDGAQSGEASSMAEEDEDEILATRLGLRPQVGLGLAGRRLGAGEGEERGWARRGIFS